MKFENLLVASQVLRYKHHCLNGHFLRVQPKRLKFRNPNRLEVSNLCSANMDIPNQIGCQQQSGYQGKSHKKFKDVNFLAQDFNEIFSNLIKKLSKINTVSKLWNGILFFIFFLFSNTKDKFENFFLKCYFWEDRIDFSMTLTLTELLMLKMFLNGFRNNLVSFTDFYLISKLSFKPFLFLKVYLWWYKPEFSKILAMTAHFVKNKYLYYIIQNIC